MKKLIGLLMLFAMTLAFIPVLQAQTSQPRTGDPTTYMTPDQLAKYQADIRIAELEKKLEVYGKWVGVGGEIGTAIEEGLSAVVGVADEFGRTEVGKFTMVMIAWKVVGKDVVRIVLGLIFISLFTWLLIYSFKRTCIDRRVLIKRENPGFMKYPKVKEYQLIEPLFGDGEGLGIIRIAHLVFFMIGIWITYGIMFGG
jgi:hypothetical protein